MFLCIFQLQSSRHWCHVCRWEVYSASNQISLRFMATTGQTHADITVSFLHFLSNSLTHRPGRCALERQQINNTCWSKRNWFFSLFLSKPCGFLMQTIQQHLGILKCHLSFQIVLFLMTEGSMYRLQQASDPGQPAFRVCVAFLIVSE